jgi:hypothetical protein
MAKRTLKDFRQAHDPHEQIAQLKSSLRDAQANAADSAAIKALIGTAVQGLDTLQLPAWATRPLDKPGLPGVPTLFLSDLHWGEVVRAGQIGGVNSYDLAIAHKRLKHTVETALHLLNILDSEMRYPGIVLPLGGDMISGNIHEELQATNELNTMPTVLDLYDNLVPAIKSLLDVFPAVFIPAVSGNHGRDTRKTWAKDRHHTSFDWLLYQFLARHFAGNTRVRFFIPDGPDALYRIFNTRYLLTHGDQFKAGDSIIGPIGPLCVTPETPVLLADLTYRPAGDLSIGDKLVGFDETTSDGRRKFREATVTEVAKRSLPCIEITCSDGAVTVASEDHPWLVYSGMAHAWRTTKNLQIGTEILSLGKPRDRLESWDAGYLAGVLDGEGCIERKGRLRFSQQDNACLAEATRILTALGLSCLSHENGAEKRGFEACFSVKLNPGREDAGIKHLQLLALLRPPRLMSEQGSRLWVGRSVQIAEPVRVVGLRHVGMRETAAFTTSTATFVANGLLTHNTRGNQKKLARNSAVGMDYDVMLAGHWHQYIHLERLIVNGAMKGYDEYAYSGNFGFEPPRQALWLTHPRFGITYRMPVLCEQPAKPTAAPWVSTR